MAKHVSQADLDAITRWATNWGFEVRPVSAGGLDLIGTAHRVSLAFHVPIHNYRLDDGSEKGLEIYAAKEDPRIPESLPIAMVFGLAGFAQ